MQPRWTGLSFRAGTPLRNRNWRRDVFDSAVAALGLKITPHNLRDTAASLAIQEGASVVAVARLLGHESAATTLNHYAGLFPTDLDDIASRLDAAARLTIASQRESSDAKQSPTKHRPDEAEAEQLNSEQTALTCKNISAPGRIRTCDTGFRRAVLYPLSYEGGRAELTGKRLVRQRPGQRSSAITFEKFLMWLSCTVTDVTPYFSR